MARLTVASTAIADAATLVAGSEASADLGVANLQDPQPTVPWRTSGTADAWVRAALAAETAIDTVALVACNLSPLATWRVRLARTVWGLTADPDYDSGEMTDPSGTSGLWTLTASFAAAVYGIGYARRATLLAHVLDTAVTCSHVRIDVTDPINPAGYVQAGRLVIDRAFRPAGRNLRFGWGVDFRSADVVQASLDGAEQGDTRGTRRVLSFQVPAVEADAWGDWYGLVLDRGRARDVVAIEDPDAGAWLPRRSVHGRLEDLGGIVQTRHAVHDIRARVTEAL